MYRMGFVGPGADLERMYLYLNKSLGCPSYDVSAWGRDHMTMAIVGYVSCYKV